MSARVIPAEPAKTSNEFSRKPKSSPLSSDAKLLPRSAPLNVRLSTALALIDSQQREIDERYKGGKAHAFLDDPEDFFL